MEASLIYPHQLYKNNILLKETIYLVEDELYFNQYKFHQNKLVLHRASMMNYAGALRAAGHKVVYIAAISKEAKTNALFQHLAAKKIKTLYYFNTTDYLLERRIKRYAMQHSIQLQQTASPNFICTTDYLNEYFNSGKKYFLASFYEAQRKRLNVLMDGNRPTGGKWSFDADNRKKMPKTVALPEFPSYHDPQVDEAKAYVAKHFGNHYGNTNHFNFPITHAQAAKALNHFLEHSFHNFGIYQDAMVKKEHFLFHSILSSSINIGLLSPNEVLQKATAFAAKHQVPLNSLEGFVRQILGWREFIRAVYSREGVQQRTTNFMGFTRKIPASFYTGNTGIVPVDSVILKLHDTAYAHHIERLMILGNFMLLCEFDPNDVYQWFMELFIDAYDWVMVPNVYGMSQFADGGLMSTKPYISSSNYILKMSDFKKGDWCNIWDALFWRFMHVHRDMLQNNPRLSMLLSTFDKMPPDKRKAIMATAEGFLHALDKGTTSNTLF